MMRLVVLSDIHGNLGALDAVLAHVELSASPFDRLWVLGDLAAYGPWPAQCVHRIRELCERWPARVSLVCGNTDRYLVTGARRAAHLEVTAEGFADLGEDWQGRDSSLNWAVSMLSFADWCFLRDLPADTLRLDVAGYGTVRGYHGLPGDDEGWLAPRTTLPNDGWRAAFAELDGRLGIGGHTHAPMARSFEGWQLLNAGSVGAPRARQGAEYLLVDFQDGQARCHAQRVPYDEDAAIADLYACGAPTPDWMRAKMKFGLDGDVGG